MKNRIKIASILTVLFIAGCKNTPEAQVTSSIETIPVKVAKVSSNKAPFFLSSSGKVVAEHQANITTRIMGYVNKIHVKTGSKVVKDQLLIEISNNDLQAKKQQALAKVAQATAVFNNSKKDLNRFKQLFKENSASQKELENITAQYKVSEANLHAAKELLNEVNAQFHYFQIKAPFDGVIVNKFIEEGNMANPGVQLLSIENTTKVKIETRVSEQFISSIKKGQKVNVLINAINKQFNGIISEVSNSSVNTGGQFLVSVLLDKKQASVLSGMFATVRFLSEDKTTTNSIYIPEKAIIKRGQLCGVYTISSRNTAILRWLRLGKKQGENVEVISGLTKGESYIISSQSKLFNGAKITVQ